MVFGPGKRLGSLIHILLPVIFLTFFQFSSALMTHRPALYRQTGVPFSYD
jgi:hypothetical protein